MRDRPVAVDQMPVERVPKELAPVEAPGEELCRLLGGRHFLPGSLPRLTWQGGSYQEVVALNIFGA